jgi:hypothetical protein
MSDLLAAVFSSLSTAVERRLFAEYGSVFVTSAVPPPRIVFSGSNEVEEFQRSLSSSRGTFGEFEVILQTEAIEALERARDTLAVTGRRLSARAADSGGRSYEDTVRLWTRNVTRGLEHWQGEGLLSADRVLEIQRLAPADQIELILEMEEREALFFGTFFDKSILYSVAAPGASQHLSLLAFDVLDYQDGMTERAMNESFWFRTVPNDLPHFTYLGRPRHALAEMGLAMIDRKYGEQSYSFWVPDLTRINY